MSIESIVKELTQQECEKYYPQIKEKVQADVRSFLNSKKGKKMVYEGAENCLIAYLEDNHLGDLLGRTELVKLARRAFRV